MRRKISIGLAAVVAVVIGGGYAQAADVAAAEALFKQGLTAMKAGNYGVACPAIAESQRIDPRLGTLFTLAECEARAGRITTAAALYEDYLRAYEKLSVPMKLNQHARMKAATAQKDALSKDIPELLLSLPANAPAGVRVTRDATELGAGSLGLSLQVDPGERVVTVEIPGRPVLTQKITVERGEKKTVELSLPPPAEKKQPEHASPAVNASQATTPSALIPVPAASQASLATPAPAGNSRRTAAFVAGGIGLAGLAAGGVTGGMTLMKKGVIEKNCVGTVCNPQGKAAADDSKVLGLVSTVGFAAGGAGLATGVVLLLLSKSAKENRPDKSSMQGSVFTAGPHGAIVGLEGAF